MSDAVVPVQDVALVACLKVVADAEILAVDLLSTLKGGVLAEVRGAFKIFSDLRVIASDVKAVLPVAKQLSADDAAALADAVYSSAQRVFAAFQAK